MVCLGPMRRAVPLLLIAFLAVPAVADEGVLVRPDRRRSLDLTAVRLHFENDQALGWLGDTDRWYTAASGLEVTWQPAWAASLATRMPGARRFGPTRTGVGLVVGGQLYTPADIADPKPQDDDRPYAAYAWVGGFWQRSNRCLLDHLQLDLGAVGPSVGGEELQRTVHGWFGYVEPAGWSNQLEDELTIQAHVRRKWRLEPTSVRSLVRVQAIPQVGLSLGTVKRELDAGVLLRAGLNIPDDFGPARLVDPGTATSKRVVRGLSTQVFGRVSGRAVEHDLFLDGNTFRDSAHIDKESLVGELAAGFEVRYGFPGGSVAFLYSSTWQSEAFQGQGERHRYSTFTLSCRFLH